jgi:hypothetical protein
LSDFDHKIFSFCEQTLKMGSNDASGQGLQSAQKKQASKYFFEKITGIRSQVPAQLLFSLKITRQF